MSLREQNRVRESRERERERERVSKRESIENSPDLIRVIEEEQL